MLPDTKQEKANEHKEVYQTPELVVWGDLRELTHGDHSGTDDLPTSGGTSPF
jgi:hypothetical protein